VKASKGTSQANVFLTERHREMDTERDRERQTETNRETERPVQCDCCL